MSQVRQAIRNLVKEIAVPQITIARIVDHDMIGRRYVIEYVDGAGDLIVARSVRRTLWQAAFQHYKKDSLVVVNVAEGTEPVIIAKYTDEAEEAVRISKAAEATVENADQAMAASVQQTRLM